MAGMLPRLARKLWFLLKERLFLQRHDGRHARFSAIYRDNLWQNAESASGYGSTLDATRQARAGLEELVGRYGISSILDVPCGDFNWMRELSFSGDYLGGDIVPELVEANNRTHGNPRRRFDVIDLVADNMPEADLVMCRECLNHLSLAEADAGLCNLAAAANKVLVVTHYPNHPANADQPASFRYRRLNLTVAPFNLRAPDSMIYECDMEPGKVLAVWDLAKGAVR